MTPEDGRKGKPFLRFCRSRFLAGMESQLGLFGLLLSDIFTVIRLGLKIPL
jgi:hypothetical protein